MIDSTTRKIIACLSFQIIRLGF